MQKGWTCVPVNGTPWRVDDPTECGFESCYEDPNSDRCVEISLYVRAGTVDMPDVTHLVAFLDKQAASLG